MPVYESTQCVEVAGSPNNCFSALTDFERVPEWQSRVLDCRVLSTRSDGLAEEVAYAIDAKLRTVRFRLRHLYNRPAWIGSEYVEGDFRCFEGDYRFAPSGEGTHVTFSLRIDPGISVPRTVAGMLNRVVMGRALQDLKRHVEEVADGT